MTKKDKITVQGAEISVISEKNKDYISLTDMTDSFKEGSGLIGKWITNKNTLEYLGIWEKINNPNFNYPEFGVIGQEAGTNRFIMSAGQWIERTKATGMLVKAGRYGGTYAHKDIAFNFAMWLSPEFQKHKCTANSAKADTGKTIAATQQYSNYANANIAQQ